MYVHYILIKKFKPGNLNFATFPTPVHFQFHNKTLNIVSCQWQQMTIESLPHSDGLAAATSHHITLLLQPWLTGSETLDLQSIPLNFGIRAKKAIQLAGLVMLGTWIWEK